VLERPLIDAALLVLECVKTQWLTDKGVRDATMAAIGVLAWKIRFIPDIESRLDHVHAKVLLDSGSYQASFVANTPIFALNPTLVQHVADMAKRNIIDPAKHVSALERFADWLAAWPEERKPVLRSAIISLAQSCAIPGLWERAGIPRQTAAAEPTSDDAPNLDAVLEKLSDMHMAPHKWSNLWEKHGWKWSPGEARLVALGRKWLLEAPPDPSWPFVWEPLFRYFPKDEEFAEVALWWLEHRGPRDRGAWSFVWKQLWDHDCARDRLAILADTWLQEHEGKHKYWRDVRARLDAGA
jgi:hypothetical protein